MSYWELLELLWAANYDLLVCSLPHLNTWMERKNFYHDDKEGMINFFEMYFFSIISLLTNDKVFTLCHANNIFSDQLLNWVMTFWRANYTLKLSYKLLKKLMRNFFEDTRRLVLFMPASTTSSYKFFVLIQLRRDSCERSIYAHISHGTKEGRKKGASLAVIYDNAIKVESKREWERESGKLCWVLHVLLLRRKIP